MSSSLAHAAEIALGTWHAAGSEVWRTSFPMSTSGSGSGASVLTYPQSGDYLIGSYETQLSPYD